MHKKHIHTGNLGASNKARFPHAPFSNGFLYLLILFLAICMMPTKGKTQSGSINLSYVTPFPSGGTYKVLVLGDGLAEGAWLGLKAAFKNNSKIQLFREVTWSAGLISRGRNDWVSKIDRYLSKRKYDIAIIMIGAADRRAIRLNGKRYEIDTKQWRLHYRKRISGVLRKLKAKKISTYWVGMPLVRGTKTRIHMEMLNRLIQIQTSGAQVRYIDHWLHFADENGQYTPYGPDVNGKIRLLRNQDGVYFTRAGYEKLGYFINTFIQRDLRDARAERNVPLLGDNSDQKYLLRRHLLDNPRSRRLAATKKEESKQKSEPLNKFAQLTNTEAGRNKYDSAQNTTVTLNAEKSQNGKETILKIVRPAIPAAAFSISRRVSDGTSEGDANGPAIISERSGGEISFAITSATEQLSGTEAGRRIPLTQTPYYKLLVRGESQLATPGRADYFSWPDGQKNDLN